MIKKTLLFLLMVLIFSSGKAVLKEKNLNQTISVLRAELENSLKEQEQTMTRYYQRVKTQHQNMVAIMQRSYQISLMLYSQKEDYTFDLSYACHEATEQYRDFKFNRMPFDKITERLENEITRYNSLIETLENLPPNKKMSQKVVEKKKNSPFMLSEKNQRFRDECVEMATKLRDNLLEMKNGIEKDKQYYTRIEKRLKKY